MGKGITCIEISKKQAGSILFSLFGLGSNRMKAIFWDNDGVLVDTERLYFRANRDALARLGTDLTPNQFREHWLNDSQGLNFFASRDSWSSEKLESLRTWRNDRYAELLKSGDLVMPGIPEILGSISEGILQGIVTSSRRDHFNLIHSRTNLLPFFSFIIAEGDYKNSKPEPDPYLAALKSVSLSPEECLVIEDSERGLRAATAAGLKCAVLLNELNTGSDLKAAEILLTDMNDLRNYLEKIGAIGKRD